jgi:transcriptional regulator with XRE-family HTH domain
MFEKLRNLRLKRGISMVELAARSGIKQGEISRIERGLKPNVSYRVIERLVKAMGYKIEIVLNV